MKNKPESGEMTRKVSLFQLKEREANYIRLVDGHGFECELYIRWFGGIVYLKGHFGEMEIETNMPVRMIETITHVFPIPAEGMPRLNSIRFAWTELRIPPYERMIEVEAYGENCEATISYLAPEFIEPHFVKTDEQKTDHSDTTSDSSSIPPSMPVYQQAA